MNRHSPFRNMMDIQCLSSTTARSAGDALRELDAMGVSWIARWLSDAKLTPQVLNPDNPFILVHSPIISSYDLSTMIQAHVKRREVDKNFIMTMGVGRGGRCVHSNLDRRWAQLIQTGHIPSPRSCLFTRLHPDYSITPLHRSPLLSLALFSLHPCSLTPSQPISIPTRSGLARHRIIQVEGDIAI
jgi:hypothetical protein